MKHGIHDGRARGQHHGPRTKKARSSMRMLLDSRLAACDTLHQVRYTPALEPMLTRPLGKQDYDHIVQVIDRWWGGPTSALAHPMFFYELGALARVVEHDGVLVGFLFGFVSQGSQPTGYVHLVGIHPDYRRRGVGKVLYQTFEDDCRAAACTRLKAITTTGNEGSIAFHRALGWSVSLVEDYAGPARPRMVFEKTL